MAIPDYESIMLPLLKLCADSQEHALRASVEILADEFKLTDEEKYVLLPSGRQATFENRVGWARTYMKKAGLLESPRRGFVTITQRGLDVIADRPQKITKSFLMKFEEFTEFQSRNNVPQGLAIEPASTTPEEIFESTHNQIRQALVEEILGAIKQQTPAFFETLVIDVLVKVGYGGSRQDAGKAIGRSGDEGIDGIIKEDKLGLDTIYIQAKRWENVVGRPEIQKFVGALAGQGAKKGIFITTSSFTKDAQEYSARVESKIVLIDGQTLADLMVDHNVGVSSVATYEIKRLDSDYFAD